MKALIGKFAPTLVVLSAAGACSWPYLGGAPAPEPSAAPSGPPKEVAAALLRPEAPKKPVRDPFLDPEIFRVEARAKVGAVLKGLVAASGDRARALRKPPKKPAAPAAAGANAIATAPPEPDPLAGLVLSATSAAGTSGGGVAVINGRSYASGEWMVSPSADGACRLAEVRAREVVLEHNGRRLTLGYPNRALSRPADVVKADGPAKAGTESNADSLLTAVEGGSPDDAPPTGARPPAHKPATRKRAPLRN
jgi:hypothetical protein